jgi:LacI family transcriptional regulator
MLASDGDIHASILRTTTADGVDWRTETIGRHGTDAQNRFKASAVTASSAAGLGPRGRRPAEAGRRLTIKDVARLAGVSVATVTRTFQDSPHVSEALRQRVLEAADALGYRPHPAAQALATGTSRTIGLLVPSLGDRFWGEVADGIERAAAQAGYSVILATSHGPGAHARESFQLLLDKGVDGVIAAGALPGEIPVAVIINPEEPVGSDDLFAAAGMQEPARRDAGAGQSGDVGVGEVAFDDLAAAAAAVEHLAGLGHRRIAFVGGARSRTAAMRIVGFRQALQAQGLPLEAVVECEASLDASRQAAASLLATDQRPSGIVAYDDVVAIAVMRAAHALGLSVPRDLSVVGFDDIDIAAFVEPPLTTIRQPKREMGETAVALLLDRLLGVAGPSRRRLQGSLVVRGSTGAPG